MPGSDVSVREDSDLNVRIVIACAIFRTTAPTACAKTVRKGSATTGDA